MNKRDYFIRCMQEGKYKQKPWLMRAFALVRETKTVEEINNLDILQTPAGFFYKGPESKLVPIEGVESGKPIYHPKDKLTVKKGELPGFNEDVETDYGRVLYHCIVFVYSFGSKVAFVNKKLDMGGFEAQLAAKLDDEVPVAGPEGTEATFVNKPDRFYPSELIRYYEAMAYSRGLAMYFVPAASPKSLGIDPAVIKRRDEIFNDPNIDLNDQATAAKVEAELVDMDRKSFENDPASGFYISKKDFAVIRKKRFISYGSGSGLTPDSKTPYIKNSLKDGYDKSNTKGYNDEMRAGSYKRGVETMYGGELDKWLVRASANIRITPDCGSVLGMPTFVTAFSKDSIMGKYIVTGNTPTKIDENNIGTYMGKSVLVRSPAACKTKHPDYCSVCLGDKLSMNPDALSIAFSQYGHAFMGESMSAMHGKALSIALMDFESEVS